MKSAAQLMDFSALYLRSGITYIQDAHKLKWFHISLFNIVKDSYNCTICCKGKKLLLSPLQVNHYYLSLKQMVEEQPAPRLCLLSFLPSELSWYGGTAIYSRMVAKLPAFSMPKVLPKHKKGNRNGTDLQRDLSEKEELLGILLGCCCLCTTPCSGLCLTAQTHFQTTCSIFNRKQQY